MPRFISYIIKKVPESFWISFGHACAMNGHTKKYVIMSAIENYIQGANSGKVQPKDVPADGPGRGSAKGTPMAKPAKAKRKTAKPITRPGLSSKLSRP